MRETAAAFTLLLVLSGGIKAASVALPPGEGKLDASGKWLPLRGVNIIALVSSDLLTAPPWTRVRDLLAQDDLLRGLYAPLPMPGLHVTIHPLITELEAKQLWGVEWDAALWRMRKGLGAIRSRLDRDPLMIAPRVTGIAVSRTVITMRLAMSGEELAVIGRLWTLVRNVTGIDAGTLKGRPGAIDPVTGTYHFHLTLAYALPNSGDVNANATVIEQRRREVEETFRRELLPLFHQQQLELQPAVLCTFDNITVFTPLRKPLGLLGKPPRDDTTEIFHRRIAIVALVVPIAIALGACCRVFRQVPLLPLVALRKSR